MVKMFEEYDNKDLDILNNWYRGFLSSSYHDMEKKGCVKRLECFLSKKDEKLEELENRFGILVDHLKRFEITMKNTEKISKFADALPAEWDEFLINLKKDSRSSKFYPGEFFRELKTHVYEIEKKKKGLINDIEKNLEKISLDVVN
ncbi:hypothetical protein Hanom_Chr12g01155661 [Helianthus anomalus]